MQMTYICATSHYYEMSSHKSAIIYPGNKNKARSGRSRLTVSGETNTRQDAEKAYPDNTPSSPVPVLSASDAKEPIRTTPSLNNLPEKNRYFTGRKEELLTIHAAFHKTSRLTLFGAGGFGKTAIALEYAHRNASDYEVLWLLNADNDVSLKQDYESLAARLGMPQDPHNTFEAVLRYLTQKLEGIKRYLLIYDNAEGLGERLQGYLPSGHADGHMLFCTRDRHILTKRWVEIGVLHAPEAIGWIQKRIEETSDNDARELTVLLGRLPLALELALGCMTQTNSSCADYIARYREYGSSVLDNTEEAFDYGRAVALTWMISIDAIECESTKQLLCLFAYCGSDDIPLSLFMDGHEALPDPLRTTLAPHNRHELEKCMAELTGYSLTKLRHDDQGNVLLSMHRFIQAVAAHLMDAEATGLSHCLRAADSAFSYRYDNPHSTRVFFRYLPHVIEMLRHATSLLSDEASRLLIASLCIKVGHGSIHHGDFSRALEYYEKALIISEEQPDDTRPDSATIFYNIALSHQSLGDHAKALEHYEKAQALFEKTFGANHPYTAIMCSVIAGVHQRLGNHEKALDYYGKILSVCEEVCGDGHPLDTATTCNNIAGIYRDLGDFAKAFVYYGKALALCEKTLGEQHPYTAFTCNSLAFVYQDLGDYDKALEYHSKALAICQEALGDTHPHTATSYFNIAHVYCELEDYSKALKNFENALVIYRETLGNAHPDTIATYKSIAVVHRDEGNYAKALENYKMVLAIYKKIRGNKHPSTATMYNNIACVYRDRGDYTRALENYAMALAIREEVFGVDHPLSNKIRDRINRINRISRLKLEEL